MNRGVRKHPSGIEGWYIYRGVKIERDDSNRGFWGHWRASIGPRHKLTTETQAQLLAQIDKHLDQAQRLALVHPHTQP